MYHHTDTIFSLYFYNYPFHSFSVEPIPSKIQPIAGSQIHSSSHGYVPLKDAPGYRNLLLDRRKHLFEQLPTKTINGDQLHETSLSDQRGDDKSLPGVAVLDDGMSEGKPTGNSVFSRSDSSRGGSATATEIESGLPTLTDMDENGPIGNGSRSALEMSMYILLGMFALVGLVFAVNCGAVVARYRWERIGRRRSGVPPATDTEGVTEVEHDMSQFGHPESNQKGVGQSGRSIGCASEEKTEQTGQTSLRRYSKLLMPFRNRNKVSFIELISVYTICI